MSLYGQYVIYGTANAILMDDFTFAYYVSSTNFESLTSVLFNANIRRFKALAAE